MSKTDAIRLRIETRSKDKRNRYLDRMSRQAAHQKTAPLSCSNQAHVLATTTGEEKQSILKSDTKHVGIVSAYNDMLSAHQPYANYPDRIKKILAQYGHTAQMAGGVPAMCDGVTQGQPGMELSLFSRDVIAQATAVALSHNAFDAVALLGICDKIAPGMLMGALQFGHLPAAFIPSGPMGTGITNSEKVIARQRYAAGDLSRSDMLEVECNAYHSAGTCTFYGTANTNQLVFESMGLMLPGSAFVPPSSLLRDVLTHAMVKQLPELPSTNALKDVVTAHSLVNGLVALLASGGSTNHTIHMLAVARAAGYELTWEDINDLSKMTPLLTRIYPNGPEDINSFEQAGGTPALLSELNDLELLQMDALSVIGNYEQHLMQPTIAREQLEFQTPERNSNNVIATKEAPFSDQGGLKLISGNLGRGIAKVSSLLDPNLSLTAPVRVFQTQSALLDAIKEGSIEEDCFIVVTHNGPAANGMPELHQLIPSLSNLMAGGLRVCLITDGRLSGASGKVPCVLHLCPEAANGGVIGKLKEGDILNVDFAKGKLSSQVDFKDRPSSPSPDNHGLFATPMFQIFRQQVSPADRGATIFGDEL